MSRLIYIYVAALIYGCVLDVYAASFVRLISGEPRVRITISWLRSFGISQLLLHSWSNQRQPLAFLTFRTVCFPVIELLTAVSLTGVIAYRGADIDALALTIVWTTLLVGAAIDLELTIYPNRLSLPLIVGGVMFALVAWMVDGFGAAIDRIGGGMLGFAVIWGIREIYWRYRGHEGMGSGDVKMCTAVGLFVGIKGFAFFIMAFSLIASIIALILIAARRVRYEQALPSGGWYVLGMMCVLLFPLAPQRYLELYDVQRPYGHSAIAIHTIGRPMQDGSFGAGVRDERR